MYKTSEQSKAIFYACLVLIVGLLSIDLYNPSLPAMVVKLHISDAIAKSLVVSYLIGFAFSQLWYGPKSDQHGRKKILLVSLVLTILGNALTMFAHGGTDLLIYRFVTGLGAGGCPVISRALLRDSFPDKKALTHAFTIFAMSSQLSPAFAPMIGGFIEHYSSWQYNFLALSFITLVAFLFVWGGLVETNKRLHTVNFNVLLSHFKQLLINPRFLVLGLLSGLIFSYTIGYYTINPFVLQGQFHLSASENGLVYVFYAVGIVLGSYATKRLNIHYKPELVLLVALFLLCALSVIMCIANYMWPNLVVVLLEAFVMAILCGMSAPIILSLGLLPFPEIAGAASAMQGMLKMSTTALMLGVLSIYPVHTAWHLAVVMLIISFFVCIFALLLPRLLK